MVQSELRKLKNPKTSTDIFDEYENYFSQRIHWDYCIETNRYSHYEYSEVK